MRYALMMSVCCVVLVGLFLVAFRFFIVSLFCLCCAMLCSFVVRVDMRAAFCLCCVMLADLFSLHLLLLLCLLSVCLRC